MMARKSNGNGKTSSWRLDDRPYLASVDLNVSPSVEKYFSAARNQDFLGPCTTDQGYLRKYLKVETTWTMTP